MSKDLVQQYLDGAEKVSQAIRGLTREDLLNATLFIHGKEPEPKVVQIGPRYFLTPGWLAGAAEQTCGLLEKVDRDLRFTGLRLDGSVVLKPQEILLSRGTKLSVK